MLKTRFTIEIRLKPDTEDPAEAKQDALDFIESIRQEFYGTIALVSEVELVERPDEE